MSLIYRRKSNDPTFSHVFYDYIGEMRPFIKRVRKPHLLIPMVISSLLSGVFIDGIKLQ